MNRILFFITLFFASLEFAVADDVPKSFTFARYQPMMDRSPFAVATAAVVAPVAPNFAKDLYVANAAKSPDGDMVTIASNADKNFKKYLTTTTPSDGFSISSIEWSEKIGATKVTITKDGQSATLAFNQALLSQPIAGQPNQPITKETAPVNQGSALPVAPPASFPKPMPVPSLPMPAASGLQNPPARVRGVIPRNPTPAPPAHAVVPPAAVAPAQPDL